MWTIIKNRLKAFLLELLRDYLCDPSGQAVAALDTVPVKPVPGEELEQPAYYRVTGTAEATSEVFNGPHDGVRAKTFIEMDRVVTVPAGTAYENIEAYCIEQAVLIEQKKLSNSGYLWGKWYDKPTVTLTKRPVSE